MIVFDKTETFEVRAGPVTLVYRHPTAREMVKLERHFREVERLESVKRDATTADDRLKAEDDILIHLGKLTLLTLEGPADIKAQASKSDAGLADVLTDGGLGAAYAGFMDGAIISQRERAEVKLVGESEAGQSVPAAPAPVGASIPRAETPS